MSTGVVAVGSSDFQVDANGAFELEITDLGLPLNFLAHTEGDLERRTLAPFEPGEEREVVITLER